MILRFALVLAASAGAALAGAGLASTVALPAPAAIAARDPGPRLDLTAAPEAIGSAQFVFRALNPPAPAPVSPDTAGDVAFQTEIAETFRADVTAVVTEKGRRVVVIVDPSAAKGRRTLRVGAPYRDGWKVRAIDDAAIELRRGGEVRRIDLFAPPPGAAGDEPGAPFARPDDMSPPRQVLTRDRAISSTQKE